MGRLWVSDFSGLKWHPVVSFSLIVEMRTSPSRPTRSIRPLQSLFEAASSSPGLIRSTRFRRTPSQQQPVSQASQHSSAASVAMAEPEQPSAVSSVPVADGPAVQPVQAGPEQLPPDLGSLDGGMTAEVPGPGWGEEEDIWSRCRPDIPPPVQDQEGSDLDGGGWGAIDRVGGWGSLLTEFNMLSEVPYQHEEVWVWAWGQVLHRLHAAEGELETNRALMWLCFLPQALLREAQRGGRQGRGLVAKRFNTVSRGDWGTLVELWERDRRAAITRGEQTRNNREESVQAELHRVKRVAVDLISKGQISRAMSRINSFGIGNIADPEVLSQLKDKYPARGRDLPERVERGQAVDNMKGLRESLLQLKGGVAPGSGGLRPEYLVVLAEKMEREEMDLLEEFGMKYIRGDLPAWFYVVWLTVQTVALFKNRHQSAVRPLGMRNPLLKQFHREVTTQNKEAIVSYFEPQQLVVSKAGAAKLVFSVRSLAEARPDFVVVKLDIKNAFNAVSRAAVIESLKAEPTLKHLAWLAAVVLAPVSGLESMGKRWGDCEEGGTQGDPLTGNWMRL